MQSEMFKNVPDLARLVDPAIFENAISATKELVQINGRLMERCLENQIGFTNLCVEGSEKQIEAVGQMSNPQDYTATQTELFEEYATRLTEVTENTIKLAQDAGEEYVDWFKRNLPAMEEVKPKKTRTVKTTAKKAAA